MESTITDMDYSSEVHDEFLVQALSKLKSIAIGSGYTKLLANNSTLLNIRRILFMASNDLPWGKRKYHKFLQQTSTTPCNNRQKKLKEHNHSVDGRRTTTLCTNSHKINFSGPPNNSITSSGSSSDFSRNQALPKITKCSVVNTVNICDSNPHVVILQDSSEEPSIISKEQNSSSKTIGQSEEESVISEDGQMCESSIDSTNTSTSIPSEDIASSVETLSPKDDSLRRSNRLTSFIGDRLQEVVVPIGDRFQVSIPHCIGPLSYKYELDNSKWLGETIWPQDNKNMGTSMEIIGKGRSDSLCSCIEPNSSNCIKLHIEEKKAQLLSEIGDAYYLWDFERMGEEVSKSWSPEERESFKNLFRRKTSMSKERFWRQTFHLFPDKRRENIVSYYFNVFALNNTREQVTFHCHMIDSDDDEPYNNYSLSEGRKIAYVS